MPFPPLTVVMPAHNSERTIVSAIRSTLGAMASFDTLVVVDDGSTDSTSALLRGLVDPRVKILRNSKQMGVAKSLNIGIERSETELVARMDADDICLPWRFALQRLWMRRTSADFVFSNCIILFEAKFRFLLPNVLTRASTGQLAKLMLSTNPFIHPTALFRRRAFADLGGYRPVPNEDFDLWQRALIQGYTLERFGIPTIVFRRHAAQITRSKDWVNQMESDSAQVDIDALSAAGADARLSFIQRRMEIPKLLPKEG